MAQAEATKAKLAANIADMTDKDLQAYIDSHLPGGHKRKLAEEIMRLRKASKGGK